jgi:hypothetical protein
VHDPDLGVAVESVRAAEAEELLPAAVRIEFGEHGSPFRDHAQRGGRSRQ